MNRFFLALVCFMALAMVGYGQQANKGCSGSTDSLAMPNAPLPKPPYPPAAAAVRASGDVLVLATVNPSGSVVATSVPSGHPLLRKTAEVAASKATFDAVQTDCQRTAALTYTFLIGPPSRYEQPVASPLHTLIYAYEQRRRPEAKNGKDPCSDPRFRGDKPPTLSLSEAVELQDCLDGKVIRVYGIYSVGFEGSVLSDLKESASAWLTSEPFFPVPERCSACAAMNVWKSPGGGTFGVVELGLLRGKTGFLGFGHMNAFDQEFQVLCLDEMKQFSTQTLIFESQSPDVQKAMTNWYNKKR